MLRLATAPAARTETLTLLVSDLVDFTPLTERLGDRLAFAVMRRHHAIVREQMRRHRGVEVDLTGDGFLLAFADPVHAVQCAVAIQRTLAAHNATHARTPFHVRIGVHTGPVIRDGHALFGKAVIVAARIAARAAGGQVLLSADVVSRLAGRLEARVGARRELHLKGLHASYGVHEIRWCECPAPAAAPAVALAQAG